MGLKRKLCWLILVLMPLFLPAGCGDLEPDMQDTRTVILNMNFNQRSSSRSSQISQAEVSSHKTHLILALPAWGENLSSSYRNYYSSFAQELMNPSDNKVSLEIPLNTQMKIFAFLFEQDYTMPQLFSGVREVGYYGASQPFSIGTNTNNLRLNITLQSAGTADGEDSTGGGNQGGTDSTADTTAPTVTFSPLNGATGVSINDNIIITFSEAVRNIDNTELTNNNIDSHITLKLNNASGSNINFDATINVNKTVITINPVNNLSHSQVVYVAIGATLEDSSHNAITAANATFTTIGLQQTVKTQPPLQIPSSAYNAISNKYVISTLGHLSYIAQNTSFWNKNFVQTADIDATVTKYWDDADGDSDGDKYNDANDITDAGNDNGFSPIGNSSNYFTGDYDGAENTIHGLTITRSLNAYDTGLFGRAQGSTISDLGLTDVNITGKDRVGPLAGLAYNTEISNCYATSGNVTGRSIVGGLVGYLYSSSITNSYSNIDNVTSSSTHLGGLVGYMYSSSTILNSFSTGKVIGSTNYRGGLVGSTVTSSPVITDSFYDNETSGQLDTGKGIGKTTSQMKTMATFTDNSSADLTGSWDFFSTWEIDSSGTINDGYPFLK